ncbi:rhomboid family intramembrane serine protease [Lacihabitans soyangensis]|uniref:Rhomboid family intramembrane serine protease n=1 Tax=Lacihabitans soyangensis TaxID=869394 RepID=A0AAE3H039_9BACT|nr:rhomboid family intramembrane serine protease [Lacihabitans soyangensis]MCP9762467.1 rhomboid family intramembrane serine protease [Lacihabitans soyangensis]
MFDRITPMVKNLLIINVGVHIFSMLYSVNFIHQYFAFFNPLLPNSPELFNPLFKPWQFISYQFLHGGIGHLFSNMFGLFIFGSALETFMGSKKFIIYYLVCGVGAAVLNSALDFYEMSNMSVDSMEYLRQAQIPMVGASGAIFGILMAFGFLFPNVEMMLLFFPFPLKAKYFVALYGVYELVQGTAGLQSGIAHFAHLGGLLTGFILLKFFGFSKRNYY